MNSKLIVRGAIGLVVIVAMGLYFWRDQQHPSQVSHTTRTPQSVLLVSNVQVNTSSNGVGHLKVKTRYGEFTQSEKDEFMDNFQRRYKPALTNWCAAYENHLPFSFDAVTPEKFVERIGVNAVYREYIFVVDGITLGIQDKKGIARVDYLNSPSKTKQMAMLPDGTTPAITSPVDRQSVMKMLEADDGKLFPSDEVRFVPTGISGGLNGGVMVHVGGDPENAASWKIDMIFDASGKLAYYLRGK